jgi:hypothetical protein
LLYFKNGSLYAKIFSFIFCKLINFQKLSPISRHFPPLWMRQYSLPRAKHDRFFFKLSNILHIPKWKIPNLYVCVFFTYILPCRCSQQLFASARVGHSCWGISNGLNGGALSSWIARRTYATWIIIRILEASVIARGAGWAIHCKKRSSVKKYYF